MGESQGINYLKNLFARVCVVEVFYKDGRRELRYFGDEKVDSENERFYIFAKGIDGDGPYGIERVVASKVENIERLPHSKS